MGLLKIASEEYKYDLNLTDIAKIWRAGCIIRAGLLGDIMSAYHRDPSLVNLLLDDTFRSAVEGRQEDWRFVIQSAIGMGIPVLAMSASLAYFDAYRSERLPANLTQAQRDYFGAHTYRRIDRQGSFHTEWLRVSAVRSHETARAWRFLGNHSSLLNAKWWRHTVTQRRIYEIRTLIRPKAR
jgi:6-phosphogluconate dehydrogenase